MDDLKGSTLWLRIQALQLTRIRVNPSSVCSETRFLLLTNVDISYLKVSWQAVPLLLFFTTSICREQNLPPKRYSFGMWISLTVFKKQGSGRIFDHPPNCLKEFIEDLLQEESSYHRQLHYKTFC